MRYVPDSRLRSTVSCLISDYQAEDEMVRQHHRLNGREFEQAPEDDEGEGSLEHCSLWGRKESDTTERLNNNNKKSKMYLFFTPYSVISKRITDSNVN